MRRTLRKSGALVPMKQTARRKVLFVCLGNACRSPMAEAIAGRLARDVMEASSAGLTPLGRVETLTIETLARNGYLADALASKPLLFEEFQAADMVINMSGRPKQMTFGQADKVEDWQVEDPYGADAELYQRIFEDIEKRVAKLADRLRNESRNGGAAENIKGKQSNNS